MKKIFLLIIISFLSSLLSYSQTSTEVFETETGDATSFTDQGQTFTITTQQTGNMGFPFRIDADYPLTGWNGTAADNRYIDNDGGAAGGFPVQFTISSASSFIVNNFYLFLTDQNLNFNGGSGTVTITGKLGGITVYTATQTGGFANAYTPFNGFSFINLGTFGSQNNANKPINELIIGTSNPFNYVALDAFNWTKTHPEINVQGNSVSIVDGDGSPSASDHTDFGSQSVCSGSIVRTFTIQNPGTAPLNISSVVITGTASADYSVTAAPPGTIVAGNSATFQVSFNPSALGARNATITINSNDADEAAYDFAITGNGVDPEINVQGNSTTISDGDVAPTTSDHTDFGSQSICSGTIVRTFTIQNTGTSTLNISGVVLSGTNAADYSVTASPASTVAAAGSTTFQLMFNPSASGARNATITINSNDCDEAAYDFSITGTGIDPEVNVQGNSTTITDGDITPTTTDHSDFGSQSICSGTIVRTFTIQNTGTSTLNISSVIITGTNASDYTVTTSPASTVAAAGSTTFQVSFDPSASGARNATINISSNDCDEATYDFSITGTGIDPEINVQGNSLTIVDGDAVPSGTDHTGFGPMSVCSGTIVRTYTIQNTGNSTLNVSSIVISGTHASDYSITTAPASTVAAAGSTTFQITFNPSASGSRTATITINNNDCDETIYDYAIQGTGTDPEIDVLGNSTSIADGDVTPTSTDHTDFGSQSLCSGTIVRTFTIQNTGSTTLNISGVNVTGTNSADFVVTTAPASTVAPAGSTTFVVTFTPSGAGLRTATINLNSDDCDEAAYDFAVQGTGGDPEINLQGNATNIIDGQTTPTGSNHTGFGPTLVCSGTITRTYTIQNTGSVTLNISSVTITGPHASDFNISAAPPSTISSGSSATFQVTFDPSVVGSRQATINVFNNDCDEATYDFAIQGTGNADVTAPTVICQNVTVYLNASGNATITGPQIDNGSTDVCGIASYNVSPNTFNCSNTGSNTVTLTVTDFTGNSNSCTATVTVLDTIDPTVVSQNITAYLDASGNISVTAAQINNGSSDVCGIASMNVSPSTFTCANIGANTITLTVTDNNGNTSSSTATVTIADTTDPIAICLNPSLNLNALGTLNIGAVDINNGSNDACGFFNLSVTPNSFTCANVGTNNVILTVIDINGNTSTCSSVVTITDNTAPDANCQNINAYLDATGNVTITGTMINNGSSDACGISSYTANPNTFNCSNTGTNNVILTVTDLNGNTSTCSSIVTVLDTIDPIASCQNISISLDSTGNATLTPAMVNNGSSDVCGIVSLNVTPNTFTCANIGVNTVLLTVTDNSGNTSTCSSIVTINQPAPINQSFNICSGQNITVGISTYNTSGIYTDSLTNVSGCDSILITHLTVTLPQTSSQNINLCAGETYSIGSSTYSATGTYIDTLLNVIGCDSVVTTNLTIDPPINIGTLVSGVTITADAFATSYQWLDCNSGSTPISGETSQSFTATVNGDYAVIITINGCSDTSACVAINNVGIETNINSFVVQLYPNPSDVFLNLQIQNIETSELIVEITDINGRVLNTFNPEVVNGSYLRSYDVSKLSPGIYVLKIYANTYTRSLPFIKK